MMTELSRRTPELERIYALAHRWVTETLPQGGSMLTPSQAVWTLETLAELEEKFIGRPDTTPGKTFLQKLQDQLHDASPQAVQSMAELHVVCFLWVWQGAISAKKKLADINAILSWHPDRPQVPAEVAAAMAPGIAHPGQWAMTRRDTQLSGLIEVAAQLLRDGRVVELASEPYAFRDFIMEVPTYAADNAKLGLIHVLFPETFEPIVAEKHKRWIVERFNQYAGGETDLDRALERIRAALSEEYGEEFDYYRDPMVHRWWKDQKKWSAVLSWFEELWLAIDHDAVERAYKVRLAGGLAEARTALLENRGDWPQLVRSALHGPENNLLNWRVRDPFQSWVRSDPDASGAALRRLWSDDGSAASSRLNGFAEPLAPTGITTPGALLNLGSFLLMAIDATTLPPLKISDLRKLWELSGWTPEPRDLGVSELHDRAMVYFDEVLQFASRWEHPPRDRLDVQGVLWTLAALSEKPPGWGEGKWRKFLDFQQGAAEAEMDEPPREDEIELASPVVSVDHIADASKELCVSREFLDDIVALLDDKRQLVLYGPPGTGKTYLARRLARALVENDSDRMIVVQFHPATTYEDFFEGLRPKLVSGQVHYELRPGPLAMMAQRASEHPHVRHVMLIDELNRANIPKVFGELLYLLEYRDDPVSTLYRADERFELPGNLHFIATMNTADRSVALIDTALRRRFHFIPFFPHEGEMKGLLRRWLEEHNRDTSVADLLAAVNADLLQEVGEHLLVGPSHFMKEDLSEAALERIWSFNIYPALEELLWGRTETLEHWRWPAVRSRYARVLKLPVDGTPNGADPADGEVLLDQDSSLEASE